MSRALKIHNGVLYRLITIAHISDDERHDLHMAIADAAEEIENPKTDEQIAAEKEAEKAAKRAELQKQLADLDA